jgi:hypothetical protein
VRTLVIEKLTTHIFEETSGAASSDQSVIMEKVALKGGIVKKEAEIYGLIGVMNIVGQNYLGVITDYKSEGRLLGADINKITQVSLIPFS